MGMEQTVVVHALDPDHGYRTFGLRVGIDITLDALNTCREPGSDDVYVVCVSDADRPRVFAVRREMWAQLRERPLIADARTGALSADVPHLPPRLRWYLRYAAAKVRWRARFSRQDVEAVLGETKAFDRKRRPYFWTKIFLGLTVLCLAILWLATGVRIALETVPSLAWTAFTYATGLVFGLVMLMVLYRWRSAFRFRAGGILADTRATVRLYSQSQLGSGLFETRWIFALATALLGAAWYWFGFRTIGPFAFLWFSTLAGWSLAFVPPTVLVLGASSPRTLELLARLRMKSPCRIAALLDTTHALIEDVGRFMSIDNFRADDPEGWQNMVGRLKAICPLCVLDASVVTEHVLFETNELFFRERRSDVVVVADAGGGYPIVKELAQAGPLPEIQVYAVTPDTLDAAIRLLLWKRVYGDRLPHSLSVQPLNTLLNSLDVAGESPFSPAALAGASGTLCELQPL